MVSGAEVWVGKEGGLWGASLPSSKFQQEPGTESEEGLEVTRLALQQACGEWMDAVSTAARRHSNDPGERRGGLGCNEGEWGGTQGLIWKELEEASSGNWGWGLSPGWQ